MVMVTDRPPATAAGCDDGVAERMFRLDADRRIGRGDQITTESHPVTTGPGRVHLHVRLRRV